MINAALAAGRRQLNTHEAQMQLLVAYGIPVLETYLAHSPGEAATLAAQIDRPLALKIISPDVVSREEVGGIVGHLRGAEAVRQAAVAMLMQLRTAPAARFNGFILQPMVPRDGAYEMTLGVRAGEHLDR